MHDIPELDRAGLRSFGLMTGGLIVLLFGLLLPWLVGAESLPRWPWLVGGGLAAWALVAPSSLRSVYRLWMRFGLFMGSIMNPIVLGLVFVFVMVPVGAVMRVLARDPLARRLDPAQTTYRQSSRVRSPNSMERPF